MPLTARQQRFVEEYAACLNASEAARRAGYSARTANRAGAENLTKAVIREALANLTESTRRNRVLSVAELQEWWTQVVLGEVPGADIKDRIKASEQLAKSQGGFLERVKLEGAPQWEFKIIT